MKKTRKQFADWLKKYIDLQYEGNNAKAGEAWGVSRGTVHAVLNAKIKPSDVILKAVGWKKVEQEYYEK